MGFRVNINVETSRKGPSRGPGAYYGKVEWESVMQALADIGYKGDLNYEASNFLRDIPTCLRPDGLRYMAKVGHYLIERFAQYSAQNG